MVTVFTLYSEMRTGQCFKLFKFFTLKFLIVILFYVSICVLCTRLLMMLIYKKFWAIKECQSLQYIYYLMASLDIGVFVMKITSCIFNNQSLVI